MDFIDQVTSQATEYLISNLSFGYFVTFVLLSFALRDFTSQVLASFVRIEIKRLRTISVLLIATLLVPIWFFGFNENPAKLFITYCFGTSMYELFLQSMMKSILGRINKIMNP